MGAFFIAKSRLVSPFRRSTIFVGKSETHARLAAGGMLKVKAFELSVEDAWYSLFPLSRPGPTGLKPGYPDPGGDRGLVTFPVFKTGEASQGAWRVRFPSASAEEIERDR